MTFYFYFIMHFIHSPHVYYHILFKKVYFHLNKLLNFPVMESLKMKYKYFNNQNIIFFKYEYKLFFV